MPSLQANSRYLDLLNNLVSAFDPEEEFFTSDAKEKGIEVNTGYMLALYRDKFLRRRRISVPGRYMTNKYSIPMDVHKKVRERQEG